MTASEELGPVIRWVLEQPVRQSDRDAIMTAYDDACAKRREEAEERYGC